MHRLWKLDPRIAQAKAQAEVDFRARERRREWEQQPLDIAVLKPVAPIGTRPEYWNITVQYGATLDLVYAQAFLQFGQDGKEVSDPEEFAAFRSHCPGIIAEETYRAKVSKYAQLPLRSIGLAVSCLRKEVELRNADELKKLEDAVWERHRDSLGGGSNSGLPAASTGAEVGVSEGAGAPSKKRRAPAEFFEAYHTEHPEMSYQMIADRIGISRDTLFRIKGETHWVRDYQSAADFLGCRPEDLHPRNLPKRPRPGRTPDK